MDELTLLREQVATERRHLAAAKAACREALASGAAGPSQAFLRAAGEYLAFAVRRLIAQDQAHSLLLRPRIAREDAGSHAQLDSLDAALKSARAALAAFDAAADPAAAARGLIATLEAELAPRRHALTALMTAHYSIDDWRVASCVDADSILEERERYAALGAALPAGLTLVEAQAG